MKPAYRSLALCQIFVEGNLAGRLQPKSDASPIWDPGRDRSTATPTSGSYVGSRRRCPSLIRGHAKEAAGFPLRPPGRPATMHPRPRPGRLGLQRSRGFQRACRRCDGQGRCRAAPKRDLIDSWCKSLSYNGIIRARSNSTPARPYMARLRVFSLLICPSVCPLLQGSDIAFRTASRSWRIVFAKRCIA